MEKVAVKVSRATKEFFEVQALDNRRSFAAEVGLFLDRHVEERKNPPKTITCTIPAMVAPRHDLVVTAPTAAVPQPVMEPSTLSEIPMPDVVVPVVKAFP